jgi:hypothetical protein
MDSTATATNRFNQRKFHILNGDVAAAASISIQGDDGAAFGRCREFGKNSNDTAAQRSATMGLLPNDVPPGLIFPGTGAAQFVNLKLRSGTRLADICERSVRPAAQAPK